MKPVSRARHVAAAEVGEATESFLDVLRSEQFRYLDSVAEANELLKHEPGRVALVAAIQNRLTQQFFDAQRSIIMRQAVYDSEVGRIEARADVDVQGIVSAAQQRVRALTAAGRPLAPPAGSVHVDVPAPEPGLALVRRTEEALAGMAASGESCETDPAAAQRQLGALLDQWWTALNQDGQGQIDQAHARAAMRRHVASIESGVVEMPRAHTMPTATSPAAPSTSPDLAVPGLPAPGTPTSTTPAPQPTAELARPAPQPQPPMPVAPVALRPPALPQPVTIVAPVVAAEAARPLPPPVTRAAVPEQMPARLLEALESAPIGDLRALLATLDHFLEQPHTGNAPASPRVGAPTGLAVVAPRHVVEANSVPHQHEAPIGTAVVQAAHHDLVIRGEGADADVVVAPSQIVRRGDAPSTRAGADVFWSEHRAPLSFRRIVESFPTHVVLPMVVATSVITLVMALVG